MALFVLIVIVPTKGNRCPPAAAFSLRAALAPIKALSRAGIIMILLLLFFFFTGGW